MRSLVLILTAFFIMFLGATIFADVVERGEFGVLYNCGFPVKVVELDGNFNELFWTVIPWDTITCEMGWGEIPENDEDLSFEFACVADEEFLYVGVKIYDDVRVVDEDVDDNVYHDDCVEIYIDGGNEKTQEYDLNDTQIMIGRDNVGYNHLPDKPKLSGSSWRGGDYIKGADTGTKAFLVDTNYGWIAEIAVPFDIFDIKVVDGTVIGFNIQVGDDDDNGDRDHKLGWSAAERVGDELSYINPSIFGELKFVTADLPDSLSVSSKGKLAETWGFVKQ